MDRKCLKVMLNSKYGLIQLLVTNLTATTTAPTETKESCVPFIKSFTLDTYSLFAFKSDKTVTIHAV